MSTNNFNYLNEIPGIEGTQNKFVESLNSYNEMFDNLINMDPQKDSPDQIKKLLNTQLNAVIESTQNTIEKSAETLNRQMKQAEEELLDTTLLETLKNQQLQDMANYGKGIKDAFKDNTGNFLEPLKGFTKQIADITEKMPAHAEDLRQKIKEFEKKFEQDPQLQGMNQQFKDLDAEMKKLNTFVETEHKNLNDLNVQLQGTVENVEVKYKEAIDAEGQKFKEQLETEYEKIREKMEEDMRAEIEKVTRGDEKNPLISPLYEEKVDKMEKKNN